MAEEYGANGLVMQGLYWLSTPYSEFDAYSLGFDGYVGNHIHSKRQFVFSVRLVQEAD